MRAGTFDGVTLASRTGPLEGRHVDLVPIDLAMAADLAAAAAVDRSTYEWAFVPDGVAATETYLAGLIADRDAGKVVPFAHRLRSTGRFVGCTRFLELRWFRGRPDPDEVEIGGTWIGAEHQRSPVNTEAKLLMLTHAFEIWNVWRVAIATDERNDRSRTAIARLGATFEGILRNHRGSWVTDEAGRPRHTAMFSITDTEWPGVKQRLIDRLDPAV
jgi:RimJ/RimL family protein N-acetyltransferase